MTDFSVGDVAFAGFRLLRERPKAFAIWLAVYFGLAIIGSIFFISAFGPAFTNMQAMQTAGALPPAQVFANFGRVMGPMYGILAIVVLLIYPVIFAAMSRAVLRPQDDRFAYLRVGADEMRQLGLMLLYILVMIGAELGAGLVAGLVIVVLTLVAHGAPALVGGLGFLVMLGVFAALIFVGVRLSLASPLTFATGRIDLFGSWKLTKGRFWPLFGVAAVVFLVAMILHLLVMLIAAVVTVATGVGLAAIWRPDMSSLAAYFTAGHIVQLLLGSVLGVVEIPLWLAPPAAIYQQLTGDRDAGRIQDVFA